MDKPKVFISYSRPDADWARSFAEALMKLGLNVWFDEFEIQPGESLRDGLESGLRESDVFVVLIDPNYPSKPNVFFELGAAIGMGKKLVPIVPKEVEISSLPLELRLRKFLVKDSPEETAEELSHALTAA